MRTGLENLWGFVANITAAINENSASQRASSLMWYVERGNK